MKDAMPASRSLPQGTIVGRYTIGRRIGRGGMGSVYEAVHNDLKKPVAIKTLDPKFADDPEVSLRFLREGEAAARIRHPHVVDIYDVGTEGDITYLVMELLAGEDLRARIARSGPLSPEAVADILLPVCAALATAHEGHVVHRDMKPANIFLARRSDGRSDASVVPKILDFGISKTVDGSMDGLTSTGSLLGTPHYMSPEQAHGGVPVDHRADIYSLGVVLYESVTGARPFTGQSTYQLLNRIVEGQFPPPRAIKPRLDADLERIILRAMARQPHERYPTATELGAALLPFGGRRTQAMWAPVLQPSTGALIEEAAYAEPVLPSTGSQTLRGEASTRLPSSPRRAAYIIALLMSASVVGFVTYFLVPTSAAPLVTPLPVTETIEASPLPLPPPPPLVVEVQATPATAEIVVDGQVVGTGRFEGQFARDGARRTLLVRAPGFEPRKIVFADEPPPAVIRLRPVAPAPPPTRPSASEATAGPRVQPPAAPAPLKPPTADKVAAGSAGSTGAPPERAPVTKTRPSPAPKRGTNDALILR